MSFFVTTTPAPIPRSKDVKTVATFYGVLVTVMLVAQLFTFEKFLQLLIDYDLPGGEVIAYLTAALIVVVELLALPFLLRMSLSPAFRWVSMVAGWLVALVWLKLTLWQVITQPLTETVGFLGTVVDTMPGWWAVCLSASFGVLAAWASWGMWPKKRSRK
jgi:hypothetical protein